jgi:23S rRNA (cytosine1962-C5)-methyltransferase
VRRGGILVAGGIRLALPALPEGEAGGERAAGEGSPWPDEPVFAPDATRVGEAARLAISAATARALRAGHPWVLPDAATGDPARFRPGALVHLAPPRGPTLGLARVEGPGPVAARVWAMDARRPRDAPSLEARVHRALGRRRALLAAADAEDGTDAFRLVHGEADGLPGLAVDRLGALVRVLVTGRAALPLRRRVVDAVLGGLGRALPVVEVRHLLPAPPRVSLRAVTAERGAPPPAPHPVREDGLVFRVDPGLGRPDRPRPGVGLFLDQRANRARVRGWARGGGRYLNLFAHTGAFSVALLAGGADEVMSVDLSAPYLAWLEAHLAANAGRLDPARHRAVRGDARRFVEGLPPGERFDGIVLDPPTAAAAGRRFWSVEQGLARLAAAALARLAPGGWLLLCRNERRARTPLRTLAAQAARDAGVRLAAVEDAPPGEDFPRLAGFPEGDPFEGVRLVRAAS